jgi:hypothetical protein
MDMKINMQLREGLVGGGTGDEGKNMIKVHCMYIWKSHNETHIKIVTNFKKVGISRAIRKSSSILTWGWPWTQILLLISLCSLNWRYVSAYFLRLSLKDWGELVQVWPWTPILLISASQVVGVTGMYHHAHPKIFAIFLFDKRLEFKIYKEL